LTPDLSSSSRNFSGKALFLNAMNSDAFFSSIPASISVLSDACQAASSDWKKFNSFLILTGPNFGKLTSAIRNLWF
jgi:hypothetical protein